MRFCACVEFGWEGSFERERTGQRDLKRHNVSGGQFFWSFNVAFVPSPITELNHGSRRRLRPAGGWRGTRRRAWQQRVKYVLDWLVQVNKAT